MAHESFEDIETAKIMNENFINIKVDREERPDLDLIFQKSLGILTGAIAKKKPSKTATEPRANKILSIILSHFL